jgi:hypothetical protein
LCCSTKVIGGDGRWIDGKEEACGSGEKIEESDK